MVSSRPGSTGEIKPPVPASKAAAVAKIRAAIAQVNITAKKQSYGSSLFQDKTVISYLD